MTLMQELLIGDNVLISPGVRILLPKKSQSVKMLCLRVMFI